MLAMHTNVIHTLRSVTIRRFFRIYRIISPRQTYFLEVTTETFLRELFHFIIINRTIDFTDNDRCEIITFELRVNVKTIFGSKIVPIGRNITNKITDHKSSSIIFIKPTAGTRYQSNNEDRD